MRSARYWNCTADAVHACFHTPYDARVWARDLPPREFAVLDAAAERVVRNAA